MTNSSQKIPRSSSYPFSASDAYRKTINYYRRKALLSVKLFRTKHKHKERKKNSFIISHRMWDNKQRGKSIRAASAFAGSGKSTLTVELRIAINHGFVGKVKIHKSFAFFYRPPPSKATRRPLKVERIK